MKLLTAALAALMTVILTSTAWAGDKPAAASDHNVVVIEKKPKPVSVPKTFGSSRLWDWFVLDNTHMVVELDNGDKYLATFMGPCHGLRFTDSVAFETSGPFELDRWTTIHLPDGESCFVKDLTPYREAQKSSNKAAD